ncbi:YceI family protein [uncultured Psychroserpens sp.]|uniref:YceI family protein n=1 Tax=uncultured Psychroserpens sp. TaxID=255436 RepID=UPI002610D491|nr:YceI family protein [uncultured Psychroserpens sp.]
MKCRNILILLLFLNFSLIFSQEANYWPDKVKLIPGLDTEIFSLDKAHSNLEFSIKYFGIGNVKGSFGSYQGTIMYNENDLSKLSLTLLIDTKSINTGSNFRDKDLQKEYFFDSEKHRFIKFQSSKILKNDDQAYIIGDLFIKGVKKEIKIPFELTSGRFVDDFWSNINIGFKGHVSINRNEFNIHGGKWGEKVLSDEVEISFSIIGKQPNTMKWGTKEDLKIISEIYNDIDNNGVESGINIINEIIDNKKISPFSANVIGKRLIQHQKYKKAISFLNFIKEKFPKNRVNYSDIARAHLYLGDFEKAKEFYIELNETSSIDTEAMEVLKKIGH